MSVAASRLVSTTVLSSREFAVGSGAFGWSFAFQNVGDRGAISKWNVVDVVVETTPAWTPDPILQLDTPLT